MARGGNANQARSSAYQKPLRQERVLSAWQQMQKRAPLALDYLERVMMPLYKELDILPEESEYLLASFRETLESEESLESSLKLEKSLLNAFGEVYSLIESSQPKTNQVLTQLISPWLEQEALELETTPKTLLESILLRLPDDAGFVAYKQKQEGEIIERLKKDYQDPELNKARDNILLELKRKKKDFSSSSGSEGFEYVDEANILTLHIEAAKPTKPQKELISRVKDALQGIISPGATVVHQDPKLESLTRAFAGEGEAFYSFNFNVAVITNYEPEFLRQVQAEVSNRTPEQQQEYVVAERFRIVAHELLHSAETMHPNFGEPSDWEYIDLETAVMEGSIELAAQTTAQKETAFVYDKNNYLNSTYGYYTEPIRHIAKLSSDSEKFILNLVSLPRPQKIEFIRQSLFSDIDEQEFKQQLDDCFDAFIDVNNDFFSGQDHKPAEHKAQKILQELLDKQR